MWAGIGEQCCEPSLNLLSTKQAGSYSQGGHYQIQCLSERPLTGTCETKGPGKSCTAEDFYSVSSLIGMFQSSMQVNLMLCAKEFLFPFTSPPINEGRYLLLSHLGTLMSRYPSLIYSHIFL